MSCKKENKCHNFGIFCDYCKRNSNIDDYYWSDKEWKKAVKEAFK